MDDPILADLFAALHFLVLERVDVGLFKITGNLPNWFSRFCDQDWTSGMNISIPQQVFSFLENFLIDAEEFWHNQTHSKLSSGIWTQSNLTGKDEQLEAYAMSLGGRHILLIELSEDKIQSKHELIQIARQQQLSYQQLLKDNQKKEVLIHCIIHDIAGQLNAINCCLALLEFEVLTPKGQEYLEIASKESLKQEMLIRDILDAFSSEMQSIEDFTINDIENAPDILYSVQEVIQLFNSNFALNNKYLRLAADIDITADWKVVGEASRLDRIITNLVENAYRHSPPESTVTIGLEAEVDSIMLTVDDEGVGVSPMMVEKLFKKFSQGQHKSGRAGLGLYFCRITVERWGGTIGYLPRPQGGSRFWFRLPRPTQV